MAFALDPMKLAAMKSSLEALAADPTKAPIIDAIHKIVHAIAVSDPVADRAMIDKYLAVIGWVAFFIPGASAVVALVKGIVDTPGGVETIIEIAKMVDDMLPPLPVPPTP